MPKVLQYQANRNYVSDRLNEVSRLSMYLRYRLLRESEVCDLVTSNFKFDQSNMFLKEVCWRTYWRGYLFNNPKIYSDYQSLKISSEECSNYVTGAIKSSEFEPLSRWDIELNNTGYLHNHIRMYFASILVHTLKVPWHIGAQYMFERLLDADPASNTLSWRWIAGLHTKGKAYLATADNIYKFTFGRDLFDQSKLASEPVEIMENRNLELPPSNLIFNQLEKSRWYIISDEELSFEQQLPESWIPNTFFVFVKTSGVNRTKYVQDWHQLALKDAIERLTNLGGKCFVITNTDDVNYLNITEKDYPKISIQIPLCGEAKDRMLKVQELLELITNSKTHIFMDKWDAELAPHAKKGFFTYWDEISHRFDGDR